MEPTDSGPGDGGSDAEADAGALDTGMPCEPGELWCSRGSLLSCTPRREVVRMPCGPDEVCIGEGRCGVPCADVAEGADVGCELYFTTPLHTDVGTTPEVVGDPESTIGSVRFPFGVLFASASDERGFLRLVDWRGNSDDFEIQARSWVSRTTVWLDHFAQTTRRGQSGSSAVTAFASADGTLNLSTATPVATWIVSPLAEADLLFPACAEPWCRAPSREGTLLSVARARGSRWVVLSRPTEAEWNSCESRVEVQRSSFVHLLPVHDERGAQVRVTLATRVEDAVLRSGGGDLPRPGGEAGETLELEMYGGGGWQLVPAAPRDEAECAPEPGEGCLHRCTTTQDLTGTVIEADASMLVLSGHECARAPEGVGRCGHLLEQTPAATWHGTDYVFGGTASFEPAGASALLLALDGETRVETGSSDIVLALGSPVSVPIPPEGLVLHGDAPFVAARIAHGGAETEPPSTELGVPALVQMPPTSRWATTHRLARHDRTVAVVVASTGTMVELDGSAVTVPAQPVGEDYEWWEIAIPPSAEAATIITSRPASVDVAHIGAISMVRASAAAFDTGDMP